MGGGTIVREGEWAWPVQQGGKIEGEFESGLVGNGQRDGNGDARHIGITSQMIGPTIKFAGRVEPQALDGKKDVTALPIPMQAVEIWIEGMLRRKLGNVGMVEVGV